MKKLFIVLLFTVAAFAQSKTQIVMLGTGNPNPDPDHSGPATAIVVNGSSYLIDCGPGIVRRAAAAATKYSMDALKAQNLKIVFITHLHSDHTLGLPDLIFSPWTLERVEPLKVYGPRGIRSMADHIEAAYAEDIRIRTTGGQPHNDTGYKVDVHELPSGADPSLVYKDANVTVTAFGVKHGSWERPNDERSFGYIFQTPDRKIVISGDTAPTEAIAKACNGCDVLIHEAYSQAGFDKRTPDWKAYHSRYHTSAPALAKIANEAKPGLLILYHQMPMGQTEDKLVGEITKTYSGKVVSAHDLDLF
jgi:ribonuclease BN (tRNA processing enzyme)